WQRAIAVGWERLVAALARPGLGPSAVTESRLDERRSVDRSRAWRRAGETGGRCSAPRERGGLYRRFPADRAMPCPAPGDEGIGRQRRREVPALGEVAAGLAERGEGGLVLDALGDRLHAEGVGQGHQRVD